MNSTLAISTLFAGVGLTVSAALYTNITAGIVWEYSVDETGGASILSAALQEPAGCQRVRQLVIPQALGDARVRELGKGLFKGQEWIGELLIPEGLFSIEQEAFASCHHLTNVVMAKSGKERGVGDIWDDAFADCTALRNVTFSDSLVTIGSGAFQRCVSLSGVELPFCLLQLGVGAFEGCQNLVSPRLPGMVQIRANPFSDCSRIKAFSLDEENRQLSVRSGVLYDSLCEVLVAYPAGRANETFSVPSGIRSLLGMSFQGATELKRIELPSSLREIGAFTFVGCGIETVTIPDGVQLLGDGAFADSQIQVAVVGTQVAKIGGQCFAACQRLREIHFRGCEPEYYGEQFAPSNCVLYVDRRKGWKGVTTFHGNTVLDEPGQYGIDAWAVLLRLLGALGVGVSTFFVARKFRH